MSSSSTAYTVTDKNGIHARPAGLIVQTAKPYSAAISLTCGEKRANCKKLIELMQLGVSCGDTVTITAQGDDSAKAVADIEDTMRRAGL